MGASVKSADFTNVKERSKFNRSRIPAGDYLATIVSVEDSKSKKSGEFQYEFALKINKRSQSVFPYYCQLKDNQLWKIRNLLIAAGINVPKSRTKIDPNKVVGRQIGVTIEDADDYGDREQSELTAVFPASELTDAVVDEDDDDDTDADDTADDSDDSLDDFDDTEGDEPEEAEDEAEAEEEPEEEEAEEGDEYDAMERLDLRKVLKKLDPELKTSTKQTDDDLRDLIRSLNAKAAAAAAKKPAAKKTAKKQAKDVSDDELEELDLDDL